ncbi:hypothetical protein FGIG_10295 [Fasciola gigantica]|uniref:Uncharacterized protein n=1 Tax=Fasciola gigantica TaxID=46835 RepID=A0A504YUE3_FASGI|nr:hypothetical protein FGIG_10295 [Fasciola gigantica]
MQTTLPANWSYRQVFQRFRSDLPFMKVLVGHCCSTCLLDSGSVCSLIDTQSAVLKGVQILQSCQQLLWL